MDDKRRVKVSKYLSKHLRHAPERLGLTLAPGGWVAVDDLLRACADHNFAVSAEELREVVESNEKQRFAFDETGALIRELHMRHHFQDDTKGFGVSAPFWDYVFGTPQRRKTAV